MSFTNSICDKENNLNDIDNNNANDTSNLESYSDQYEILIKLREENNSLLIRLRDFEKIKNEFVNLKNDLSEIEMKNRILGEENE